MALDYADVRPSRLRMWGTLLWEQWCISRAALLLALTVMLGYSAQSLWLGDPLNRYLFYTTNDALGTPCFLWAPGIVALLFMHVYPGLGDIRLDFPRRYFVLPIATRQVMLVQLTYRLAVACVLALIVAYVSSRQPDAYLADLGPLSAFIVFLGVVLGGQALGVLVNAYGVFGGCVMAVVMLAFLFGQAFLLVVLTDPAATSPAPIYMLCAAYALLCICVSWVVMGRARHGETIAVPRAAFFPRTANLVMPTMDGPFSSKLTAQIWFEWKRSARYFAWGGLAIGALTALFAGFAEGLSLLAGFWLVVGLAFVVGYTVMRTPSAYLAMVAVKPMTNAQIGTAKLAASLVGFAMVLVALALATIANFSSAAHSGSLLHQIVRIQPMEVALTAGGSVVLLWLALLAGRLLSALVAAELVFVTPLVLFAVQAAGLPWLEMLVYTILVALVTVALGALAAWGLYGRIPWRRLTLVLLLTCSVLYVILFPARGLYGYKAAYVAHLASAMPWLGLHYRALPVFTVAIVLLGFSSLVAKELNWRRVVLGISAAYLGALVYTEYHNGGVWDADLVGAEALIVFPLAALILMCYIAWKRRLVSAVWGVLTVVTSAAAMLVFLTVNILETQVFEEAIVAGLLLIPLCAATPLWPPLAVRLQRHR